MMAHLNAIRDLIVAERGFTVYIMSVPEPNSIRYPYVLISPGYGRLGERPLGDRLESIDHDLQVRSVGTSPASMMGLLGAVREVLSPGRGPRSLVVPGRKATVKFLRHEMTDQDRDVRVTATGQHPIFGVDAFRLLSTPQRAA